MISFGIMPNVDLRAAVGDDNKVTICSFIYL